MPTVMYDPTSSITIGGGGVTLQAVSPGVQEVGNFHINGVGIVGSLMADTIVETGDGAAANPAYTFTSDTTLGWYSSGANIVSLAISGAEAYTLADGAMDILSDTARISFGAAADLTFERRAAATFNFGAPDAAAPVANTITFQGARGGVDANTNAVHSTVIGSLGTGTGTSGNLVFQVGTPQNAGNNQHVAATALTLHNAGSAATAAPQALLADGTALLPSLSYTGDPTTGIFKSGASQVSVAIAGNQMLTCYNGQLSLFGSDITLGGAADVILHRRGAANLNLGSADAAAPVAQTLSVQGARGATDNNTAGVNFTVDGSLGTGNAASGDIIFRVGTPQAAGNAQHVAATALTLKNNGAGGTAATQAIFNDGSALLPSIVFSGASTSGLYNAAGSFCYATGGGGSVPLNIQATTALRLANYMKFGWVNGQSIDDNVDACLTRRSAANINLGAADAAAPVAQNLSVQGVAAGTADTPGTVFGIEGSRSTGSGAGGAIAIKTTYPGAAAAVQNALSMRNFIASGWTTLTEGAATSIATVTFSASSAVCAEFLVLIEANDGTDYQSLTSRVRVSSVRKAAGNTVSSISLVGTDTLAESTGASTLTVTFTVTEGAAACTLNANATSSLAQTTFRATFQAIANGPNVAIAQS